MKVLLINPPELYTIQANLPGSVERLRGATPPIGLMCVAATVRASGRHSVSLLDAHALGLDYQSLEDAVRKDSPNVVGVTSTTFTMPDVMETVQRVRSAKPDAVVVCGGLQPFLYPKETAALGVFDYCLQGEADRTFPELLDALEDSRSPDGIPGLIHEKDGRSVCNDPPPPITDLDSLPMPAHDLLSLAAYSTLVSDLAPAGITVAGRGCPFHCAYCSHSVTGKKFRNRSAERIDEEMAWCRSLGIRYLLIYDEVMTVRKTWVMELCDRLSRRGNKLKFMARARAGTIDAEMLRALKSAGCDLVTMGVESGSPRILRRLNRPADLEPLIRSFREIRKAGMRSIAYFMIDNPDEEPEDFRKSVDVARRIDADLVHAAVFVPYPATDLYEEAVKTGRFVKDIWREFSAKPEKAFRPRLWNTQDSEAGAMKRLADFYRLVYFHPKYLIRRAARMRRWSDVVRNARGFFTVLSGKGWTFAKEEKGTGTG